MSIPCWEKNWGSDPPPNTWRMQSILFLEGLGDRPFIFPLQMTSAQTWGPSGIVAKGLWCQTDLGSKVPST